MAIHPRFGLHPAGADAESETPATHFIERRRGLRDDSRVAEGERRDEHDEVDRGGCLSEASVRRQGIGRRGRVVLIEEVIRSCERIDALVLGPLGKVAQLGVASSDLGLNHQSEFHVARLGEFAHDQLEFVDRRGSGEAERDGPVAIDKHPKREAAGPVRRVDGVVRVVADHRDRPTLPVEPSGGREVVTIGVHRRCDRVYVDTFNTAA